LHIVLTFHEACIGMAGVATCIAESSDAGASWKLIPGDPIWNGNEGQLFLLLDNSHTWIWASQTNGFYRSENSGASWTVLLDARASRSSRRICRAPACTARRTACSTLPPADGIFEARRQDLDDHEQHQPDWRRTRQRRYDDVCQSLFLGGFCDAAAQVFLSSPETDGVTWTLMPSGPRSGWAARCTTTRA